MNKQSTPLPFKDGNAANVTTTTRDETTTTTCQFELQLSEGVKGITNLKNSITKLNTETNRTEHDKDAGVIPSIDRSKKVSEYTGGYMGASSRAHKYIFSIWYASRYGRLERVQALLDRKTPVDALDKNNKNCTALHWACKFGHLHVVKLLIKHGASTNNIDTDGNSPLHFAAGTGGSLPLVRYLLENASEVRLLNSEGHTPAMVARLADKLHFAELIERWHPCGGFTDLRAATFDFQRVSEDCLKFTLPPVEKERTPIKPIKWLTPSEAINQVHQAKIERQLHTQREGLRIKEHRLGDMHPSIGVTLQRMAVLLRELGKSRRKEAITMLLRCRNIFRSSLQALESMKRKSQEQKQSTSDNAIQSDAISKEIFQQEQPIDILKARDPQTNALLIPLGSDLPSTIRLRREQLCDVLELTSELLCADHQFEESKELLEGAVHCLRGIETTVSTMSSTSLVQAHVITSTVPPLRWATALTNLALIERQLSNEKQCRIYLHKALNHVEQHLGTTIHAAEILEHIAVGYAADGNRTKSAVLRERVLKIVSQYDKGGSISLALAHENLGEDYYSLKKFKKSEEQFQCGLVIREHLGQLAKRKELEKVTPEGSPEMKVELRPTEIGHTVTSVIDRLERREIKRRGSGTNLIKLASPNSSNDGQMKEDPVNVNIQQQQQVMLSGPKILMEEDIQRSYRNVATAGISSVKRNKKARRRQAKEYKKMKARAKRLIIADDRKYVNERAKRHAEGLIKLTGLRN
jgi:hypothetical protein